MKVSLWSFDFKESHLKPSWNPCLLFRYGKCLSLVIDCIICYYIKFFFQALVGAFASIQAIKVGSESKVDSKSQWPYGSGYGMMGHGMMEDCMMCDSYHGCPSWCYGWNYPYQANVVISEKSDNKVAAQPAAKAQSNGKWMYPYGYGYQRQCMMCDMYYGCPSWCYSGWNYPYQALSSVNDKSDAKWWYGNGNGMMRECMMCDMYYTQFFL